MKKIVSWIYFILFLISTVCQKVYAVNHYGINIAVFCVDEAVGRGFIRNLCECSFERGGVDTLTGEEIHRFIESESTGDENKVVLYDQTDAESIYHVTFHLINPNNIPFRCGSFMKKCVGAIVLYDISDPNLEPIIGSRTFYREDLSDLIKIKTPLNTSINFLQSYRCGIFSTWNNALEFITYNIQNVSLERQREVQMGMNRYTCELEAVLYGVDNKWNRGHPDIDGTGLRWKINPLSWIIGASRRRIVLEGKNVVLLESIGHSDDEFGEGYVKKKNEMRGGAFVKTLCVLPGVLVLAGVVIIFKNRV